MKKIINWIIISLASIVLICGIVASCFTLAMLNEKTNAYYDKDGKIITTYDVSAENEYRYVKRLDIEFITTCEYYNRHVKYNKILMNRAKDDYEADKTDEKLIAYNQATASYKKATIDANDFKMRVFGTSAATFFGTYFPIVVLLGVALLINKKIDYRRDK